MKTIFEIEDKTGREIRLTKKQWKHITTTHAEMTNYLNEIQKTIEKPLKVIPHQVGDLRKFYMYIKHRKHPEKFLRIVVKYLNGKGFIITAQFVRHIK